MTTPLNDALNSSSIVLGPHKLQAYWREVNNDDIATNLDALGNLTDQHDGTMTVEHSLDDGLPDSVTMTTGNDAAGTLTAGLNGREGLTLAASGQRPYNSSAVNQSLSATRSITGNVPSNSQRGDYLLCAVITNSPNAVLVQTAIDPKDSWDYLGNVSATGMGLYVFGTRLNYPGRAPLQVEADASVNWISMTMSFWATNPLGIPLRHKVSNVNLTAETTSRVSHQVRAQLRERGYQVGIWASLPAVGPWSYPSGGIEWIESVQNGLDLMMSVSPLRESGSQNLNASTTLTTAQAIMGSVSLEPYARPRMDARQYFSPFNKDSPVFGFSRDTAAVLANIRVLTGEGPVDTQVFRGQMQDLPINGRSASVQAVSKARINLNKTVNLPIVSSNRENLSVDWLAGWLMARGGSFVGAAPNVYTRFWCPMYGSLHNYWGTDQDYNAAFEWRANESVTGRYGVSRLPVVPGPNGMPAMFGQQTATRTTEINLRPLANLHNYPRNEFPHLFEGDKNGPLMMDLFSKANARGRVSFWVRCDPIVQAPSYLVSGVNGSAVGTDVRAQFSVECRDRRGGYLGWVRVALVSNATGNPSMQMGTTTNGFGSVFNSSYDVPQDGQWHFFGFWWDFIAGQYALKLDGLNSITPSSYFATNGWNYTADLPETEEQLRRNGGRVDLNFLAHAPISDLLVDAGQPYSPDMWDDVYPHPAVGGANAVMRPTYQNMMGLAEPEAVNAWDTFAELARSSLSAYRADEKDAINFLPLSYFGEPAQMNPVAVQDVNRNSSDLDLKIDNTKTRNAVTVEFQDLRLDSSYSPVLAYATALELPRGKTTITFPLDTPAVEIHGAGGYNSTTYAFINLTANQIAGTEVIPRDRHYISVNNNSDGGGAVLPIQQVSARFVRVDAGSVTIEFVNKSPRTVYLANNGQDIPYMRVLGYGLRGGTAYATVSDAHSVAVRGERGLDTALRFVQDRETANNLASLLVGQLAQPRAELSVNVVGDPRRKPGDLVTLLDKEGTRVEGTWRVINVGHNLGGAQYTQDLKLVQQYPVAVWGGQDGWGIGVWGA